MTTTPENITDEQIRALQVEAASHDDRAMVDVCAWALDGAPGDREECADRIADAEAMDDQQEPTR